MLVNYAETRVDICIATWNALMGTLTGLWTRMWTASLHVEASGKVFASRGVLSRAFFFVGQLSFPLSAQICFSSHHATPHMVYGCVFSRLER